MIISFSWFLSHWETNTKHAFHAIKIPVIEKEILVVLQFRGIEERQNTNAIHRNVFPIVGGKSYAHQAQAYEGGHGGNAERVDR